MMYEPSMSTLQHILARKTLAGLLFAMVFLLTPRVMVEGSPAQPSEYVALEQLDSSLDDECAWCAPALKPVGCDTRASKDAAWLNPDAPIPSDNAPCIDSPSDPTEGM